MSENEMVTVPAKIFDVAVAALEKVLLEIKCRDCEHYNDDTQECEAWAGNFTDPHGWCYRSKKRANV